MPIVVSDTSPIRALHHLKLLHLLPALFDRTLIPPAVVLEWPRPRPRFVPISLEEMPFALIQVPSDQAAVAVLAASLGPGESEAIVLATELRAELLIDEALGREEAQRRGLTFTGVLGLLVRSKERGLITSVSSSVDRLRRELAFFVSDDLADRIRRQAGE